jgi:glyoxylate carboligase
VYPFLELGLGLGYLSAVQPPVVYVATIGLMSFGALGVLVALRKRHPLNCACLGSALKVPLSAVALAEDVGMAAVAAMMLMVK